MLRVRAHVTGRVQGVGFRPYVFALANELELAGFVLNDSRGVVIEVEGPACDDFLARLPLDAPPLAAIDHVVTESLADSVVVVRSEHIPRIQEAHASAYHTLVELL